MRVPTRNGVLAAGAGGGGGGGAGFVTEHNYAPAGVSQAVSFTGAAAGNLAVVSISNYQTSAPAAPAGWTLVWSYTWVSDGYFEGLYTKVLSAGDILAGSVTFTGLDAGDATIKALFYTGATAASMRSVGEGSGTATALGFVKSVGFKALVTYCTTRGAGGTPTAPGTTVNRIATFASGVFRSRADDILNPANYVDGTGLTYTGLGIGGGAIAVAIELT